MTLIKTLLALAVTACSLATHAADPYPAKPVKFVVPWPAGQATDAVARAVAERMGAAAGQPFVIDNKAGAGGALGAEFVAKATGDGYTLLAGSSGSITVNPLFNKVGYSPRSFATAGMMATVPYVLVTAADFPAKNGQALVEALKKEPGKITYASSGSGSMQHMVGEAFLARVGAKATHIPYKGSAPALTDVIAGRVNYAFETVTAALPHIKSGRLKALAISSERPSSVIPEVPPLAEAMGVPGFDMYAWIGVVAPAGTPPAMLDQLNAAIQAALKTPEVRTQFRTLGVEPMDGMSRAEAAKVITTEHDTLSKLIASAGIKPD